MWCLHTLIWLSSGVQSFCDAEKVYGRTVGRFFRSRQENINNWTYSNRAGMNSINGGYFVWISGVYKQHPAPRLETKCQTVPRLSHGLLNGIFAKFVAKWLDNNGYKISWQSLDNWLTGYRKANFYFGPPSTVGQTVDLGDTLFKCGTSSHQSVHIDTNQLKIEPICDFRAT